MSFNPTQGPTYLELDCSVDFNINQYYFLGPGSAKPASPAIPGGGKGQSPRPAEDAAAVHGLFGWITDASSAAFSRRWVSEFD